MAEKLVVAVVVTVKVVSAVVVVVVLVVAVAVAVVVNKLINIHLLKPMSNRTSLYSTQSRISK